MAPDLAKAFSLIRQLQGALQGERRVRGSVTSSGTIEEGSGWTVVRNGAGDYTITFDTPFADTPSVILGTGGSGSGTAVKLHGSTAPSASGFRAFTFLASTAGAADNSFTFVAIGP